MNWLKLDSAKAAGTGAMIATAVSTMVFAP
jgi:hypothetical protein